MTEPERLQKLISRSGVASRREAEALIVAGRVRVNGEVCTTLGTRVDSVRDDVRVDGVRIRPERLRDILFHKPVGVVTTHADPRGRPTIFDRLPAEMKTLRYVGRLDMNTSGLLLLTNRGDLIHRLTHPSWEVEREYRASIEGHPTRSTVARLLNGIELDDGPARVRGYFRRGEWSGGAVALIVLTEGRNRQVRRMLEAVGHPVHHLERVRFGPIHLGSLAAGEWRELDRRERQALEAAAPVRDPDETGR